MIVYCCSDLIFATKIGSTAEAIGVPARPARNADALQKRLEQVEDGRLNDPVTAVMVDLDLADAAIALIEQTKKHHAGVPVIAFGSHVAVQLLRAARDAGADTVLSRGQFVVDLPALLERHGGATL